MFRKRVHLNVGWADGNGEMVRMGDRLVHEEIRITFPGSGGQPRLEAIIDSSSGVPRCTDLRLLAVDEGREVRSTDLRKIEVESLIEAVVPLFAIEGEWDENGAFSGVERVPDSDSEDFKRSKVALRQVRRASRRKVTPVLLNQVAEVYLSEPQRPAEAVELAFGVSPRTAYRYISLAREQGLLDAPIDEPQTEMSRKQSWTQPEIRQILRDHGHDIPES